MLVDYRFITRPSKTTITIGEFRHKRPTQRNFVSTGLTLVRALQGFARFTVDSHVWKVDGRSCLLLPSEVLIEEVIGKVPAHIVYYFFPDETVNTTLGSYRTNSKVLRRGLSAPLSPALNGMLQDLLFEASTPSDPQLCAEICFSLIETLADKDQNYRTLLTSAEHKRYQRLSEKSENVIELAKVSHARHLLEKQRSVEKVARLLRMKRDDLEAQFQKIWSRKATQFVRSLELAEDKWKERAR